MIQHNSPDQFMSYFEETMEELTSLDKNVLIIGNFNIDLLKCETSQISHDFLMSLQSCYLIPTVDKPTRVHRSSATLIVNRFLGCLLTAKKTFDTVDYNILLDKLNFNFRGLISQ